MATYNSATAKVSVLPAFDGFQRRVKAGVEGTRVPDLKAKLTVDRASLAKAEAEVKAASARIEKARTSEVKSTEDVRIAEAKLADARKKFAADSAQVVAAEVRVERAKRAVTAASRDGARAAADESRALARAADLRASIEAAGGKSRGFRFDVDHKKLDRVASGASRISGSMVKLAATSTLAAAAVSSVSAASGGLVAVGSAAVAASGAAAVLPGVLVGVGAAAGVAKIGLTGFFDGVSKGGEDLAKLSPNARKAAEALRALQPQWDKLRTAVQDRMFRGVDGDIRSLATKSLPLLQRQLPEIAAGWNDAFRGVLQYLAQKEPLRQVGSILDNTKRFTLELGRAFAPAVAGLLGFSEIGARYLPAFGKWLADGAERFAAFVNSAAGAERIKGWIDGGIEALRQLGQLASNIGGIVGSVFRAMSSEGASTIQTLNDATGRLREFLNGARGQEILTTLFSNLRGLIDNLRPGLDAVGRVIGHLVERVAPLLPTLGSAISNVALAFEPLVKFLITLATSILQPVLSLISQYPHAFVGAAVAVGSLAAAIKILIAYANFKVWLQTTIALLSGAGGVAGAAGAALSGVQRFGGALVSFATGPIGLSLLALAAIVAAVKATSVSVDDAAAAMRNGGAAAEEMRAKVASQTAQVGDGLIPVLDRAAAGFDNWVNSQILGIATTDSVNAKMAEQDRVAGQLTLAYTYADQKFRAWQDAVNTFGANSPQAILANQNYQTSVDNLKVAQQQAGQAVEGHTEALKRQRNQFLGQIDTEIAWKAAIDSATQSVATNGRTVDLNTEAGRANMTQLQGMSRAAFDDIDAKAKHGASTQTITDLTNKHRQQLYDTAIQMGMSKEEARRYVDQLNLTPGTVNTQFNTPGLAPAIASVKELNELIGGLKGDVNFNVGQANLPRNMPRLPGRADGGPIYGPGTSTSDSILARLSNGEFVVQASAVQKLGLPALHAINSGVLPTAAFAGGGVVSGTRTYNFDEVGKQLKALKDLWFPPIPPVFVGGGNAVERWRPMVLAALARQGFPPGYADRVLMQIRTESGGDPNAINLWDINAKRGIPSRGLLQTVPGTFAAYRDPGLPNNIYDPFANINASLRYARSRYGTLDRAYRGVGYRDGGVIPGQVTGRDDKVVLAGSGERILTPDQNRWLESALATASTSGAVSAVQRGRGLDGVSATPRTMSKVGIHADQLTVRETLDFDVLADRAAFEAGHL